MENAFHKADKKQSKLRLALIAPSGFGKTYSALRIAKGLGGKTAVLDTENGSADLYAKDFEYDVATMVGSFEPNRYIKVIQLAEEAGYDNLIIDSLSHAWVNLLEQQGAIADKSGNSWAAWRKITPEHNKLVDTIIQSKLNIICTLRAKSDWVVNEGKPVKVGLAPQFRDGIEYEFTTVFDLDASHNGHCSKDRTKLFDNKITPMTEEVGISLNKWLNE